MQTRKLGRRTGLTLALCGAILGGALPGGIASALAACPAKATTALSTGKLVAAVRGTAAPDDRQIYSMNLDGTGKTEIVIRWYNTLDPTKPIKRDLWRPRISPDRKSVLFYTGRDDYPGEVTLWSAPISGRDGLSVANQPDPVILASQLGWPFPRHANAEYSPDGAYLVFEATTAGNAQEQIYVLDICAGTATPVSTQQNLIRHRTPSFSHNQATILYSRCPNVSPCRGTDHEIYRMSTFGDVFGDTRLTNDGVTPRRDMSPIENPAATTIAFTRFTGCKSQIYTVPAAGGTPSVVVDDANINLTPSWDRTLNRLYFGKSPNGTQWQLAWVARTGGAATAIPLGTPTTPPGATGANCGAEFANLTQNSPSAATSITSGTALDMNRMVVSVTRPDGPGSTEHASNEIYSMNVNGTAQTRLTFDEKGSWWPQLSPNRKKILYYKGGVENYNGAELWVMNWDGSGQAPLIPATGPPGAAGGAWDTQGHAAWSPDGNYIVMFARTVGDLTLQLWVTNSSGTSSTRISNANPTISRIDPSWSNDQAWIIYTRCPSASPCGGADFEVYKQSVFGDTAFPNADVRLTSDAKRDHDPFMSPDGTEIAFLRQVSCNRWGIFKISSTAAFPVTSATTVFDDMAVNSLPGWSRDSSKIYFHRLPVPNWESDAYRIDTNGTNNLPLNTGSHCNVEDPNATAVSG